MNGVVRVCPERDRECGVWCDGWCKTCPLRTEPTPEPEAETLTLKNGGVLSLRQAWPLPRYAK